MRTPHIDAVIGKRKKNETPQSIAGREMLEMHILSQIEIRSRRAKAAATAKPARVTRIRRHER